MILKSSLQRAMKEMKSVSLEGDTRKIYAHAHRETYFLP